MTSWKPLAATLDCGLFLLVAALLGGGCQSARERYVFSPLPPGPIEETRTDDPSTHRMLSGEEITFRFPEGTNYTTRVKEDGTISLPLVGSVNAAGKIPYELYIEVSKLYVPRFYKHWPIPMPPEQRIYSVGGQVRQPGRQVYIGPTTVTKAIQSAGDFAEFANGTRVKLVRANGEVLEVNCVKLHSPDPPIYPGDKITVPQRTWWDWFR